MKITGAILFFSLMTAAIVIAQIYLSKKDSKWLGLILPGISFSYSLIALAGLLGFLSIGAQGEDTTNLIVLSVTTFIYSNIPTAILLGIYFHYREKKKKLKELDKMNIQDLN